MSETGDPYEGADPRLAWALRVLSDEFGMLGVMETQQAAYYYATTNGRIDNRLGPGGKEAGHSEADRKSCMSCHVSAPECDRRRTETSRPCCGFCEVETFKEAHPVRKTTAAEYAEGYEARNAAAWERGKDQEPGVHITDTDAGYVVPQPEETSGGPLRRERESDGDMLARLGTDAVKWADEFVAMERRDGRASEGTLIGWFASAIGAGESKNAVALDYLAYLAGRNYREKATEWFENYYGTENFNPPGPDGLVEKYLQEIQELVAANIALQDRLSEQPEGAIDWKMRATAAETELALAREDTTHVANADRIRLAKDALMSSGYFDEGQVDDEIAPRIRELIDAHNSGFLKMQDDLNRQITKWRDRAVVAERRMDSVRTFVHDNLRVTQDEE